MSATASTGSPTIHRSIASRNVSQENAGSSEEMAARTVSYNFENFFAFTEATSSLSFRLRRRLVRLAAFPFLSTHAPPQRSSTNLLHCNSAPQRVKFEDILQYKLSCTTDIIMKDNSAASLKKSATALGSNKLGNLVAPKVSDATRSPE